MAIFHLSVKAVSRSTGRSAVAAAAYRSAEQIVDRRTGQEHDFTKKAGVEHSEIVLPADAPEWARDRAQLWNAAEAAERRKDAKTAREYEVALPHELSAEQRREAVREYAGWLAERHGVAVDVAIHAPGRDGDHRNHHAHLLTTTRTIGPDGLGEKTRALDVSATAGPLVEEARAKWEEVANRALERAHVHERVDHRSLEAQRQEAQQLAAEPQRPEAERAAAEQRAQDLDRAPTVHMGPTATAMERQGIQTDRGDTNRAIRADNAERRRLWEQVREWGHLVKERAHQVVDQVREKAREVVGKVLPDRRAELLAAAGNAETVKAADFLQQRQAERILQQRAAERAMAEQQRIAAERQRQEEQRRMEAERQRQQEQRQQRRGPSHGRGRDYGPSFSR